MASRYLRSALAAAALTCVFSAVCGAQSRAYSIDDILAFLSGGVSSSAIVERVKTSCIDFKLTSSTSARLREGGATADLLKRLRSVCYRGEDEPTPKRPPASRTTVHDTVFVPSPVRADTDVAYEPAVLSASSYSHLAGFDDRNVWIANDAGCTYGPGFSASRATVGGCSAWLRQDLPQRASFQVDYDHIAGDNWGQFSITVGDPSSYVSVNYDRGGATFVVTRHRGDSVALEKSWIHGSPGSHDHVVLTADVDGALLDIRINGVIVASDSVKSGVRRSFGVWLSVQAAQTASFADARLAAPAPIRLVSRVIPILDEDFSGAPGGYTDIIEKVAGGDESACFYAKGGGLRIENRGTSSACIIQIGPEANEHTRVETSLTRLGGPADSYYALIVGLQAEYNFSGGTMTRGAIENGALAFGIDGQGNYTLQQIEGGAWTPLIPWTPSAKLNKGDGASNRLAVVVQGRRATLFANGVQLNAFTVGAPIVGYPAIMLSSAKTGMPVSVKLPFVRMLPGQ